MNQEFKKLKQEYEQITPTKEFKKKIQKMVKRKNRWLRAGAGIVACCAILIGSLNAFPVLANGLRDLPGMENVVNVLTFGRYHVEDQNFYANVVTPQIEGLLDKNLQDRLNQQFKANADMVIAAFETDYKELKQNYPDAHMGMECSYEVRTDTPDYLAIDVYWVELTGSSSTTHHFYTIDKRTGELVTLKGLFRDGADYITPISSYIRAEMDRLNATGENAFWMDEDDFAEPFQTISAEQNFYINGDGALVICFDKYEVAPGSSGSPEFIIPEAVIQSIRK